MTLDDVCKFIEQANEVERSVILRFLKLVQRVESTPNEAKQLCDMEALHDVAKAAKADETVACPNCGTSFKKRAWNQAFCKAACKDNYWNLVKPERLKAARGG